MNTARTPFRTAAAMGLVSFCALSYEVTLTRIFSFVTDYHFVYLVIGLALLGYGAAGSGLAWRGRVSDAVLSGGAALFAVAGIIAVLGLGNIAFNPSMIFEHTAEQLPNLLLIILVLCVPFIGAGTVICGILSRHGADAGRVYAFDLVGAGLGCAATPVALQWLGAPALAGVLSLLLAGCAWLLASTRTLRLVAAAAGLAPVIFLGVIAVRGEPEFHTPPGKPYHYLARSNIPIEFRQWSALPRIDVTAPRAVPVFGFGGDLSPKCGSPRWKLRGVFQDGTAHTAMLALENPAQIDSIAFLDGFVQGSAFPLRPGGNALVIGVGGGIDLLIALKSGIQRVVGVEMNPIITDLLARRYRDFTGGLADDPRIELVTAEGRQFLSTTDERFDVIQLSGVDTFAALSSGAFALAEAYLYTVEAVEEFFDRLAPGGILSYSRYYLDPPRETIRNASNMVAALARRGITDPSRRLLIVAGASWANCMVKPDGFSAAELAQVRAWAGRLDFRLLYDPERPGKTAFDRLIRSQPAARAAFLDDYHYDARPSTDDQPFFFQYCKPSKLFAPEAGVRLRHDWILYVPSGLITLLTNLVVMGILSVIMILGPIYFMRRRDRAAAAVATASAAARPAPARFCVFLFFAGLGLGFLFLEIALMQRFTVFLGNPTYALSVILFTLLASSGLGSALSRRMTSGALLWLIPIAIVAYLFGLRVAIPALMGCSLSVRVAFAVVALAPLGLLLGMAFPLGIRALSALRPATVPWAFAINACFTVLGSAGAVVLALLFGFPATFLAAAGVYLVALLAFRGLAPGLRY